MKVVIPVKKPRNPFVPAAAIRKAGKHRDKKRETKNKPPKELE